MRASASWPRRSWSLRHRLLLGSCVPQALLKRVVVGLLLGLLLLLLPLVLRLGLVDLVLDILLRGRILDTGGVRSVGYESHWAVRQFGGAGAAAGGAVAATTTTATAGMTGACDANQQDKGSYSNQDPSLPGLVGPVPERPERVLLGRRLKARTWGMRSLPSGELSRGIGLRNKITWKSMAGYQVYDHIDVHALR